MRYYTEKPSGTGTIAERVLKARAMVASASAEQLASRIYWKGVKAACGLAVKDVEAVRRDAEASRFSRLN